MPLLFLPISLAVCSFLPKYQEVGRVLQVVWGEMDQYKTFFFVLPHAADSQVDRKRKVLGQAGLRSQC